ncbi:MAG: hypothetical protein WBL48_14415 [Pseudolabrys sp.]
MTILIAAAPFSHAFAVDDAEALAIAQKHCVMCHAAKPTHESFQEAPKKHHSGNHRRYQKARLNNFSADDANQGHAAWQSDRNER